MQRRVPTQLLSLPLCLLLAANLAATSRAQEPDEIVKPLSLCSEPTPPHGTPPEIELDEWIDTANPLLGFAPPPPGSVGAEKAAGEVCVSAENRNTPLPEEPYEKAESPEPLRAHCAFPEFLSVQAGLRDHYALPFDPANLTQEIRNVVGVPDRSRWIGFDQDRPDLHFGHRFEPSFHMYSEFGSGTLKLHLRPLPNLQQNDTISLWVTGASRGWGVTLSSLGYNLTAGQETTIELDLHTLQTGTSTILSDISQFGNLNVYIQDDTAVDDMTLTLGCDDKAIPVPLVGVLRGAEGCGSMPAHDVFFDNEDNRNANSRGGWNGATVSDKNTLLRLCGIDGRRFSAAARDGAGFALVALGRTCPEGFTRFDRYHDNEDSRPASWDNAPSGSQTVTTQPEKNTNVAFCVATGTAPRVPNSAFPDLGVTYGVFGGRTPEASANWALDRGFIYLDDEDKRNRNTPASPPAFTDMFLQAGGNTTYFFARVK